MNMEEKILTHGIKLKDKIGYALGDAGGLLTFSLIGAFQNKFYTDALGISPAKIAILILVARVWDAINDPLWGAFIQSRKPRPSGQFRPWILGFSIPLAISAALMFLKIPGLSEAKYLAYAYITYIMYGLLPLLRMMSLSAPRFQCGVQSAQASADSPEQLYFR